ncbi:hypothetical protein I7I53_08840 [Histoplasma capsulatum var. duboisii H88]|uniref:Uncharacterized protein n=1 Tax=Ajellomyces capsulatus (strain H88) TaxID=544711 RepID=A0A8A1L7N6_AJEC8|nr:hypothetical protein I7I53_08840 [Histoplasma capsulatum var. duboisii H88]
MKTGRKSQKAVGLQPEDCGVLNPSVPSTEYRVQYTFLWNETIVISVFESLHQSPLTKWGIGQYTVTLEVVKPHTIVHVNMEEINKNASSSTAIKPIVKPSSIN